MLGDSDQEYSDYLRQQLKDAVEYGEDDDIQKWTEKLRAHVEKVKAGKD